MPVESEPNNTLEGATAISLGSLVSGTTGWNSVAQDPDWFTLTIATAGVLRITMASDIAVNLLSVYSADGTLISSRLTTEAVTGELLLPIYQAGQYYLQFNGRWAEGGYSFTATQEDALNHWEEASNDTMATADVMVSGQTIRGVITPTPGGAAFWRAAGGDVDWYAIDVDTPSTLQVAVDLWGSSVNFYGSTRVSILRSDGTLLTQSILASDGTVSAGADVAGTYYVQVRSDAVPSAEYRLTTTLVPGQTGAETEGNNDRAHADVLAIGTPMHGQLSDIDDVDVYAVSVPGAGLLNLHIDLLTAQWPYPGAMAYPVIRMLDASGNIVALGALASFGAPAAGTYYIEIRNGGDPNGGAPYGHYGVPYDINVTFDATALTETEPNNTMATADGLGINGPALTGSLMLGDPDWFRLEITQAGDLTFDYRSNMAAARLVYDAAGNLVAYNAPTGVIPGTYYVQLALGEALGTNYTFAALLEEGASVYEREGNNTRATANLIDRQGDVRGQITTATDHDWFAFDLPGPGTWRIPTLAWPFTYTVAIENSAGQVIWSSAANEYNTAGFVALIEQAGRYYVHMSAQSAGQVPRDYLIDSEFKLAADRVLGIASSAAPTDRFFADQHFLEASPTGLRAQPVWADYTGRGVEIAVFDDGIDPFHNDLDDNYIHRLDLDSRTGARTQPALRGDDDAHGTSIAGIIASERNGIGTVGIAYNAELLSIYSPLEGPASTFAAQLTRAYQHALNADILNNSWVLSDQGFTTPNTAFIDNFQSGPFAAAGQALSQLASQGRGGLGTIVVQAAGQSDGVSDDTNLHNIQNSRYVITVATNNFSSGSSILVSSPTVDGLVAGRGGYSDSGYGFYTPIAPSGAGAAVVSGVVALMLEANPNLGYRDVQEILAYSARNVAPSDPTWQTNGALNWNGGGLHYSEARGYGQVGALAAVRLAETWDRQSTQANVSVISASAAPNRAIPDNDAAGVLSTVVLSAGEVERVEVDLQLSHSYIGDLAIILRSPSGTEASLLWFPTYDLFAGLSGINFTFGSAAFWGEQAAGNWDLFVVDLASEDVGVLQNWTLRGYGDAPSADDTYVYTDEYGTLSGDLSSRQTLADPNGGSDTINAAAVTTGSRIDLAGGASTIAGRSLAITAGTIEAAYGGDGNDTLIGNAAGNYLYGGRGDDLLQGGDGNDTLAGGIGNDTIDGGAGFDLLSFAGALGAVTLEAGDQVSNVEAVWGSSFADNLTGSSGDDQLSAGAGDDTVLGGLGNDYLAGESGDDSLSGGDGFDWLWAGIGNDTLDGGAAKDNLNGEAGDDLIWGGGGNDRITGRDGNDTIHAGEGNDWVGVWNDWGEQPELNYFPEWGDDEIHGEGGDDVLSAGFGRDTVHGGIGNDYLAGEQDDDLLFGGDGEDWLWAGSGNDTLDGGAEKDNLNGEAGDDLLWGGAGNDRITGQAGNDTIHAGDGNDWVGVWNDWGEQPELNYFPEWGDDLIFGDAGNDVLSAGFGNDTVHGGADNDYVAGEQGDDLLFGEAGVDWLWGGSGNDTMEGGEGDDVLIGEEGIDLLSGGLGADIFAFLSLGHAGDRILDFDGSEGDRIDVSGLLLEQSYAGSDPFGEGRLLWEQSGAHVLFRFDTTLIATIENTSLAQLNDAFFIV